MVNFGRGLGGHIGNIPNNNCQPDQLNVATSRFGRTAEVPMLWNCTENDSYFASKIAHTV